ncbi:MAG TPA: ECF-type sigma factor [Thermoanaerobaculia bacterium]|jgi:RNA polymerase sigma factor (TIGR02999 family)|nr:ECF-type sigma factor [Thermoanaerobaculia bacterium]
MGEITQLLIEARSGDAEKLGAVFAAVYPELKRLAAWRSAGERAGSTLTTTALVHETYLKLVGAGELDLCDRRHFFNCAARAMRHILVDHARAVYSQKRGGGLAIEPLPEELAEPQPASDWIDLDRALQELAEVDPQLHELVELRYFAGLSREEVAELLGRGVRTVARDWLRARAFLYARLEPTTSPPP